MKHFLRIFIVSLLAAACTENPFYKDTIRATSGLEISGRLFLEEESDHSGVFIWAEGLDIVSHSEKDGRFRLSLPANIEESAQSETGYHYIYFYCANYLLARVRVFVFQGRFKYKREALDEKGRIKEDIRLQKLLHIRTLVEPAVFNKTASGLFRVTVELYKRIPGVRVYTFKGRGDTLRSLFIKKIGDPPEKVHLLPGDYFRVWEEVVDKNIWSLILEWPPEGVSEEGRYELWPFVGVEQTLPDGLLQYFGENAGNYSADFLNVPIRMEKAVLTIP